MMKLPEKMRKTLEKTVKKMRTEENICGIGLTGSWSRGTATSSSDIDLLILDENDFNYEYVEREKIRGLFIDFNHVPKGWIQGPIPSEIDQKLYEMQILYDRDWSLTNTKLLMTKSYGSPERVEIRTETHVIESDIYLSRATSAFSREDFRSAQLFVTVALEKALRVLVEIALEPFSNSHFLSRLEGSTEKMQMRDLFEKYVNVTRLKETDGEEVNSKLKLFKKIWDEMSAIADQNSEALEASHFKTRTKLKYYLNPAFLRGMLLRSSSLLNSGKVIETSHYLKNILIEMLENYVWLKSSIDEVKIDYTTLMRSLESLEEKNPKNYMHMTEFLGLANADKGNSAKTIRETREVMVRIRKERKALIKNHVRTN